MIKRVLTLTLTGLIALTGCSARATNNIATVQEVAQEPLVYDKLQQFYLDLGDNVTLDELKDKVRKLDLKYYPSEGAHSLYIKIAPSFYNEFGDTNDNFIQVHFDKAISYRQKVFTLLSISYSDPKKEITAFHRIATSYQDNDLPLGYYIDEHNRLPSYKTNENYYSYKTQTGRTIKTYYIKVDSKEEQLEYIHNYIR